MNRHIYLEGAASRLDQRLCRQAFSKLLVQCGFEKRMPRLTACGSRNSAFDDFKTAFAASAPGDYIAMLIDSEEPVLDLEKPWSHLGWTKPSGADDEHVLFMTTCMETWIVADRATLRRHYKKNLQETALPPLHNLEARSRHDIQDKLTHATRECPNAYRKGRRSFEILEQLNPEALMILPSFTRAIRILKAHL